MKKLLALCILCIGTAITIGAAARAQEGPPPQYGAMARLIIAELAERQFEKVSAQYDERLAQALPVEKLEASWDGLIARVGEFKSINSVEQEERSGYHVIYAICAFTKQDVLLVLAFNSKGQFGSFSSAPPSARIPWKAPDYAKPESFEEHALTVHSGHWDLPGTLTLPKGSGPFPAVVLVHGSGPNDQDESIGANKPFKDLAWGLASRGVASLRYIKRTLKYGAKSFDDFSVFTVKDETIDDARAAVEMLAGMKEIDPHRIFVIGHSLGAFVAPRIATGDAHIAGIVMLAGNTRPLEDLVVEQVRYEAALAGNVTPESQKMIDRAEESARQMRNPDLKPGMTVDLLGSLLPASYVLDLRSYHPAETAAALKTPMYILQGGRDYQVRAADFDGWKKALAGKPNATFKLYPDLNHLFIAGTGASTPAEYLKPGHVSEEVIADIAAWIAAQAKSAKQ